MSVTKISAVGTRGKANGVLFVAKRDSTGHYILNKKMPANSRNPTNNAVNKVSVSSLDEAAKRLKTGEYLINLVDEDGNRALRALNKIKIECSPECSV